jgi:hypothetical protein
MLNGIWQVVNSVEEYQAAVEMMMMMMMMIDVSDDVGESTRGLEYHR